MSDDLKLIYTGSRVESLFLVEILEDNGIEVMRKDTLAASVMAGWADGSPEDAVRILVLTEDYEKAKKVLDEYFASRDEK
jgi:hypothetical protein